MLYVIKQLFIRLVLMAVILLQIACTSLIDKGDKLYEAGDFEGAASYYQRALTKNPENLEARIALKQAREKIIDRGLIDVRMLRLGENLSGAAMKLEEMLRNQHDWKIAAKGAVAATQAEELRFALPWYKTETRRLADKDKPDVYRWHIRSFEHLIAAGQLHDYNHALAPKVQIKGSKKCSELASSVKGQRFYLRDFVSQYCKAWDKDVKLTTDAVDRTRFAAARTQGGISVRSSHERHNLQGATDRAKSKLKTRFLNSPWYSAEAQQTLTLNLDGQFDYRRYSERVKREIFYPVTIRYTEKNDKGEDVKKEEEATRRHEYWARVYHEEVNVRMSLRSSIFGTPIMATVQDRQNRSSESHNERFEAADLYPRKPELIKVEASFSSYLQDLTSALITDLAQAWENRYCDAGLDEDAGEALLRCARSRPEDTGVNAWFMKEFGLDRAQLVQLYPNL